MSKLRHIPYAVLTAGLFFAGSASAQTWYDAREANQQKSIQDGRRDGSLTGQEYRRLEQGQQRIEQYERRAERDGVVSPQERARLDRMLDRQGREINQQRHDGQIAWGNDRNHDGRPDGNRGNHYGWDRGNHYGNNGQHGWNHDRNYGPHTPGLDRREANQQSRIYNGVHDGSINRGEFNRLERGENRINQAEARAKADGVVTPGERTRLNNMANRESTAIHNARTNTRTAPPATTSTSTPTTTTTPRTRTSTRTESSARTGTHGFGGGHR